MDGSNSANDQKPSDRNSATSKDQLVNDAQSSDGRQTPIKITQEDSKTKKKKSDSALPTTPDDKPSFKGPFGITTASTIVWYVCICILFVIAFLALVLSVLYFITDTTTDQVVKLYGIAGSGALAIVTFVIVFLDCCNDGSRQDHEEETIYRVLQMKDAKEKEIANRRKRRIAEGKEEKPKPFIIQHQKPQQVSVEPHHHPSPPHHSHPHHIHHVHAHPPNPYHHPFVCPICHDLHASGNARHNLADVGVDTSDKFQPVLKNNKTVVKSTRDAQTEPKLWDAERGTQTDRNEGTQTSTMELSGMPSNITEIIHETTILKAPRHLLPTLKKSLAQQDKEMAMNRAVTDTNTTTTATIV